ncbi:Crp/Fnr family transcriptional regulator [Methylobacterium terricola]|uniref:Crp/Fnr family transcriptional regulator n=1 Tax=Methylobacterium terricola TaxID=2583531 RepID=A0A5C4L9T8_9HYPH|nr:Crp/Fnr family transcriptional regulator [Methylobacterium terricola]TNC07623.1 Crp/Fnr family transcriptional regulator [Methylobacterium terricola]
MSSGLEQVSGGRLASSGGSRHHHHPIVRKLARLVPLTEADTAALGQLSASMRQVAAHTDLVHEGAPLTEAVLVLQGFAIRYQLRDTGARQILAYLVPGDLCDPDAALLGELDCTISTLSACFVARVPQGVLSDILEQHPNVARGLRLAKLIEEATTRCWLTNAGCRSALERMAHLLCELQVRLQVVGFATEDGYELPITQHDLGDTLGLSNVHVNRTLRVLREQRLIEHHGKQLTILDLPRLQEIAEFKPGYLRSTASHARLPL